MRENVILPPAFDDDSDVFNHVVKTVCDQGHLCPLPLTAQPIYWEHHQALQLNPLPNTLMLIEQALEQVSTRYDGCLVVNPGSFARDASFLVYSLSNGECDFSQLSGE